MNVNSHTWPRPAIGPTVGLAVSMTFLVLFLAGPIRGQQPGWSMTGPPAVARVYGHTATLLTNGKVLVAGGADTTDSNSLLWHGIESAELYDPATGQWSATGRLISPRTGHIAVRLKDGKVLVTGGGNGYRVRVTTSEIYDPATGAWSAVDNFVDHPNATFTLLADGRLLVAGGTANRAELYDPATGAWSQAGVMNSPRGGHSATLQPDGRVLVVGTWNGLRDTEIYDPAAGKWTPAGNVNTSRWFAHAAALLPDGKMLIADGGISGDDYCNGVNNAEVYDPLTGRWSATGSPIAPRHDYPAILLPEGKVLIAGGSRPGCDSLESAELYDPSTGSWSPTSSLNIARVAHTATLLPNGKVLVVGGYNFLPDFALDRRPAITAELFDSGAANLTNVSAASFAAGMVAPESLVLASGNNLAAESQAASSIPLPTRMAGVSVKVRDRTGAERVAQLLFVSMGQIKYQVPSGTAAGLATVTVTNGEGLVAAGPVEIADVAPGLFSANANGQGVAAAVVWRIRASGVAEQAPVARFDAAQNRYVAVPIDLGPESDQVFLTLFGTGIRLRGSLAGVTATIGGMPGEVTFAGAASGFAGLDQVNVRLPRSLAGRGEVDVMLSVDGKAANTVRVSFR